MTVDELQHEHHIEVINLAGKGADDVAVTSLIEYLDDLRGACEAAGLSLVQTRPDADDVDGWLAILASEPTSDEAAPRSPKSRPGPAPSRTPTRSSRC